ncbi:hypothetical protein ZOSMA_278G00170 [Zostera marina]|uniref:Ubiquitin-like protease family profile domain-containing protein n=1 Tax=Zostera marina TaxID=29655 RepID=A0A0K9PDV6_ZOSMR|nr:hypothetical protein ZOSMA_278G00170 [Zostera marina]
MKFDRKILRFAFIPICTNDHCHFLMRYTDQNLYVHYDSNHKALGKFNLEASLKTISWFNYFIRDILNIKEHQDYQLLRSISQENDAGRNGGLYMIQRLRSVVTGLMRHQKLNNKDLKLEGFYTLHWTKKQVPKIRNDIFHICASLMHYDPW